MLDSSGSSNRFIVYNKGVGGNNLIDIQNRLQKDVIDLKPQIVFLQTGVNDANGPQSDEIVKAYTNRLRDVVSAIRPYAQVVLVNGQKYPSEPVYYKNYISAMSSVSEEMNVALFDRYALMESWVVSGKYKYSDILYSDSFHPNDFTYNCMARVSYEVVNKAIF